MGSVGCAHSLNLPVLSGQRQQLLTCCALQHYFKAYHQVPRAGDDTFVGCSDCAANVPAPPLLAQQPSQKLPAPQHKHSTVAGFKKALYRAFVGLLTPDPLPSAILPALKLVIAAKKKGEPGHAGQRQGQQHTQQAKPQIGSGQPQRHERS